MKRGKRIGYKKLSTKRLVKLLKRKGVKAIHISVSDNDKLAGVEMNSVILDESSLINNIVNHPITPPLNPL